MQISFVYNKRARKASVAENWFLLWAMKHQYGFFCMEGFLGVEYTQANSNIGSYIKWLSMACACRGNNFIGNKVLEA